MRLLLRLAAQRVALHRRARLLHRRLQHERTDRGAVRREQIVLEVVRVDRAEHVRARLRSVDVLRRVELLRALLHRRVELLRALLRRVTLLLHRRVTLLHRRVTLMLALLLRRVELLRTLLRHVALLRYVELLLALLRRRSLVLALLRVRRWVRVVDRRVLRAREKLALRLELRCPLGERRLSTPDVDADLLTRDALLRRAQHELLRGGQPAELRLLRRQTPVAVHLLVLLHLRRA